MGIKTVRHPPYSPDVAPSDFWLFPTLRGCRYETIEEMKEALTKVIDTLTQEDFHGDLERYNKGIAAGRDCFEGDKSFMRVLSIKVPIRKKSGNLFNDPRIYEGHSVNEANILKRVRYRKHCLQLHLFFMETSSFISQNTVSIIFFNDCFARNFFLPESKYIFIL